MSTLKNQRYGWMPDLPDQRDKFYAASVSVMSVLPTSVDMRPGCPPVYDQGALGSCTAQAIAAAFQFAEKKQTNNKDAVMPSRLFIYYNEREMRGTIDFDSGATIRDGMKSIARYGVCPEEMWPYDIIKFRDRPTRDCYQEALKHQAICYRRVIRNISQMKGCLASGYPFIFGFTVYESFESLQVARDGIVDTPAPDEIVLGGHAVLAVGYDDKIQRFIVRNSWGKEWGMEGYFTIPYDYLLDVSLAADFWMLTMVETV